MNFNYTTIKELATNNKGLTVNDLIALSRNNDPFYTGTQSDIEKGEWFKDLWGKLGYTTGVHLRRMHYAIFSQENSIKHTGTPYQNTEKDWSYLNEASKAARYLGLVDLENFVDRRNPEALINRPYHDEFYQSPEEPTFTIDEIDSEINPVGLPELGMLSYLPAYPEYITDYFEAQQAIHLELWCEKTTMNDLLLPLCEKYDVNLITGMGELSITAAHKFIERLNKADRNGQILYISDYDPSGYNMPSSISRKLEYFYRNNYTSHKINLEPVVLNHNQIKRFNLPTKPVKSRSDGRKISKSWVGDVVELDALEAIHPGEFSKIIEYKILYFYDESLASRCIDVSVDFENYLFDKSQDVYNNYTSQMVGLSTKYNNIRGEWQAIQEEYTKLNAPLLKKIAEINGKLEAIEDEHKTISNSILADMESEHIELPDVPKTELKPYPKKQLFSSSRDYLNQLEFYKSRKLNGKGK